jgi:hypothetical protein
MTTADFTAGRMEPATTQMTAAGLLRNPATWLVLAVLALAAAITGAGIDVWRHDRGGADALSSLASPGMLTAVVGLMATGVASLVALSLVVLGRAQTVAEAVQRMVALLIVWGAVTALAVAFVTYAANSDVRLGSADQFGAATGGGDDHGHGPVADHAAGVHDAGPHATMTQLMTLPPDQVLARIPEGLVTGEELEYLKSQLRQVNEVAARLSTEEAARAAGYDPASVDIEAMGAHWINTAYLADGVFDPTRPEGLLFSKVDDGPPKLVGVWFLLFPGSSGATKEVPPVGFAGTLDVWHAHTGICLGAQAAGEDSSREACAAVGGAFIDDARWMMHVWAAPEVSENPDGFFAYLNNDLLAKQQAAVPLSQGGGF